MKVTVTIILTGIFKFWSSIFMVDEDNELDTDFRSTTGSSKSKLFLGASSPAVFLVKLPHITKKKARERTPYIKLG